MDPKDTGSASLPKLVTDAFKVVAIEENNIEQLRQVFSHMSEFT